MKTKLQINRVDAMSVAASLALSRPQEYYDDWSDKTYLTDRKITRTNPIIGQFVYQANAIDIDPIADAVKVATEWGESWSKP